MEYAFYKNNTDISIYGIDGDDVDYGGSPRPFGKTSTDRQENEGSGHANTAQPHKPGTGRLTRGTALQRLDNRYAHRATALPDSFLINLKDFCMPTDNKVVTSNFGRRWGRMHKGIDVKVYIGDTIRAAFSGKVRIVKYEARGYGNYVVIRHYNGLETIYGHMSKHLVKENQVVRAGDPIGLGGNTGRSTGSHLHFETRLCGVALNPALMFDFKNQDVTGDTYMFRRDTNDRESAQANRLRGKDSSELASASDSESSSKARKATASSAGDVRYHKVKKGETLSSIAKKRGTTVAKLCKLNHITKRMRIRPGQILRYS